jgi:ubiquinone/menaquinone biosynthesis C-methylase UbiE
VDERAVQRLSRIPSPYDSPELVASYDELAVRHHFAAPARDLVEALRLHAGAFVLDVGSGTGAATAAVADLVGARGRVVALDSSRAMLRRTRKRHRCDAVVGQVPDLPFGDQVFDAALAGFSVSHFPSYSKGLAEVRRVLRPGASFASSSWRKMEGEHIQAWRDAVMPYVEPRLLTNGFASVVPWDEWFSNERNVRLALNESGFVDVEIAAREYPVEISVDEYLTIRESGVEGMLIRWSVTADRWTEFQRSARKLFANRFPSGLRYTRSANIAICRAPS